MPASDSRRCLSCSKFLPKPAGRGRPALRCTDCRAAAKDVILWDCTDCGTQLPAPSGRGRPAHRCSDCRTGAGKVLVNA